MGLLRGRPRGIGRRRCRAWCGRGYAFAASPGWVLRQSPFCTMIVTFFSLRLTEHHGNHLKCSTQSIYSCCASYCTTRLSVNDARTGLLHPKLPFDPRHGKPPAPTHTHTHGLALPFRRICKATARTLPLCPILPNTRGRPDPSRNSSPARCNLLTASNLRSLACCRIGNGKTTSGLSCISVLGYLAWHAVMQARTCGHADCGTVNV